MTQPRPSRLCPPAWGVVPSALALGAALLSGATGTRAAVPPRAAAPAPSPAADLDKRLSATVRPFLQTYCVSCHGKNNPQAQLDLSGYTSVAAAARNYSHLGLIVERLAAKEMPPPGGKQPSEAQRQAVIAWVRGLRKYEAERNAGDPGIVTARRLSNSEYDNTIRDLTGVDLRPTKEFPVDPANQEGFDNSGESLTVSPALVKKYYQAARTIADHMALTSNGLAFASHPVLVETDRDKFSILRIIDFYRRQPTDYADYFQAAWRYRHRAALGQPQATLQSLAAEARVSPKYLDLVWQTLNAPNEPVGPIARLQGMWNALPAPDAARPDAARSGCVAMRDWILNLRPQLAKRYSNLLIPNDFSPGGQCFIMWKNEQYASHRRSLNPDALQVEGKPKSWVEIPATDFGGLLKPITVTPKVNPELAVPADETARAPYVASFQRFCSVFPDAFYISERGRMHVDRQGEKGRYLSAGLHNSMGYFRDDTPLMELILDDKGREELDRLWVDFNTIARVPERMHQEFFHYERAETSTMLGPEFDFARSEDKDATSEAKIKRLAEVYLAKARKSWAAQKADPVGLEAINRHFQRVNAACRATEKARAAAEPAHLNALLDFARRAYRRPLTSTERADLLGFYRTLREKENLNHEDAVRDVLVRVLMSPSFLFRMDLEPEADAAPPRAQPASLSGAAPRKAPVRVR